MHDDLGADRGGEVGDRRQGFVIHVDEFDGVLGDVSAVGHDERHGVADELDLTLGQWRAGGVRNVLARNRVPRLPDVGVEVGGGEDRTHAR